LCSAGSPNLWRTVERRVTPRLLIAMMAVLAICGCGSAAASRVAAEPRAAPLAHWVSFVRVNGPIDVVGPRRDGSMVLAADGRLWLLGPTGTVRSFAPGYHSNPGLEAYIALASSAHKGCGFGRDTVFALGVSPPRGVLAVTAQGRVSHFAAISASGLINGIAFDETGRFGYRLLVTINSGTRTTVDAIDCHGSVKVITRNAPRMEGGIAVAPAGFGRFGGDLIAPDEIGGGIYAITPGGTSLLVANSHLPHGQDTGVESEAFIPSLRRFVALLADRLTPGNPHPGDNLVLELGSAALFAAGVRPGDLLVASEGGARTDALECGTRGCRVRHIADGPAIAHAEGHIGILP